MYRGASYSGYKVGDAIVGGHSENHSVQYRGRLSRDGHTLEGRWWIGTNPDQPIPHREGPSPYTQATAT